MEMNLKKTAAVGALCALLLVAPTPASARVTVSVEVAYGGVVGCGLVFLLSFSGSWEAGLAAHELQGALLELEGGRAQVGVPIPSLRFDGDASGDQVQRDTIQLDLLRWRF